MRFSPLIGIAALFCLLCGSFMLAATMTADLGDRAPPAWMGAGIVLLSFPVGMAALSLRRYENTRTANLLRLAFGQFELPDGASEALARLNSRITFQFCLPPEEPKAFMPSTFGGLVEAVTRAAQNRAEVQPAQHEAARQALARAIGVAPTVLPWNTNPIESIPRGRERFKVWEQIRSVAPALPPATLSRWVEEIAVYLIIGMLIAIAVPIAQRLDDHNIGLARPSIFELVVGKLGGLLLFGIVGGVFTVPVYLIGTRYASRIPAEIDNMGTLAAFFPPALDSQWTAELVAEHLRDLVATEIGIPPANLNDESSLLPAKQNGAPHHRI